MLKSRLIYAVVIALALAFAYLLWFRFSGYKDAAAGQASLAPQSSRPETAYDLGRMALTAEHYTAAISFFEHARLLRPDDLPALFYLAESCRGKGLTRRALSAYAEIIRRDPGEKSLYSLFALERSAQLHSRHDRLAEARAAYEKALARETRPEWRLKITNQLAELDLTEGHPRDDGNYRYNEAGEVIGGVGPGDMRTNQNFEIARHTADWKKKEIYFRKAIETDPGMYQAYFDAGLALTKQGRFSGALPFFETANTVWQQRSDVNPEGAEKASAYAYLGLCRLKLGQPDSALTLCDRAISLDSTYFKAYLFKAQALMILGRNGAAADILKQLLRASPDDAEVLAEMARAYAGAGLPELAGIADRQSRMTTATRLAPSLKGDSTPKY